MDGIFRVFFSHPLYQSDLILKAVLLHYYFNQTSFGLQTNSRGKKWGVKYFDGRTRYAGIIFFFLTWGDKDNGAVIVSFKWFILLFS